MEYLIDVLFNRKRKAPELGCGLFDIVFSTEVIPAEPITKPAPVIKPTPAPSQDDPFNVPAPLVDPTPKGFL